jgi:hypothetical protein
MITYSNRTLLISLSAIYSIHVPNVFLANIKLSFPAHSPGNEFIQRSARGIIRTDAVVLVVLKRQADELCNGFWLFFASSSSLVSARRGATFSNAVRHNAVNPNSVFLFTAYLSLHVFIGVVTFQLDLTRPPLLGDERFEWAVEAKQLVPALNRVGLNPVDVLHPAHLTV